MKYDIQQFMEFNKNKGQYANYLRINKQNEIN